MPDGKPTVKRNLSRKQMVRTWVPRALKRDLIRVAAAERLPLSRFCCGILRLGLGRYFELSDARRAAPLLEKLRDVFSEDAPFPPMPELIRRRFETIGR